MLLRKQFGAAIFQELIRKPALTVVRLLCITIIVIITSHYLWFRHADVAIIGAAPLLH